VHRHGPHRRPPPGAAFQPVASGDDLAGRACANELTARQLARASHTAPHERRAFHSLFRAWPAAAAAAACDHAASGAELTCGSDFARIVMHRTIVTYLVLTLLSTLLLLWAAALLVWLALLWLG
jgi:hypothetical protein